MYSTLVSIFRGAAAPPDTRIYAIGDIHGYDDALERMLDKIHRHIKKHPVAQPVIVFLGDYSSRGPQSNRVLARLAAERENQKADSVQRVFLLGDHDQAFKAFLNTKSVSIDDDLAFFIDNGGPRTLRSFGIAIAASDSAVINSTTRRIPRTQTIVDVHTLHEAQQRLRRVLPQSIKDLYNNMQFCFEAGDYFFAHAAVDPKRGINKYDQHESMLIGTDPLAKTFPSCKASLDKVVVHGHSISPKPYLHFNQIGVDTGVYKTGVLSCAVLEGKKVSFFQTKTDLPLFGQKPGGITPPTR